jgi:hypothetical protein
MTGILHGAEHALGMLPARNGLIDYLIALVNEIPA